ncbi:hypothetical protein IV203_005078 [Nitzschia inconspicua]|uniref:Uncharacterized protein n=1 Tax=Nitzschia inconspicua TaxID=303405 RepID=A0A9K3KME6_9STRA|nr:hypothetical protein IV203_005078 [Nitzschia inconspicua]
MEELLPTDEEFERFAYPWKFDNPFGIPEIDPDEVQVQTWIGSGHKASTLKAIWKGRDIALKRVESSDKGPYFTWEISRYHDLRAIQGKLIPKLFFVSREKTTGKRLLGLELGVPLDSHWPKEQAANLRSKLIPIGWRQRDCSWRLDNVVWMKNKKSKAKDKKSYNSNYWSNPKKRRRKKCKTFPIKRLVAIDLESWIPTYHPKCSTLEIRRSIFGLPILHPTELMIHHGKEHSYWDDENVWDASHFYDGRLMAKGRKVKVFAFNTASDFRLSMERLLAWPSDLERLVVKPLSVLIGRSGKVIVVYENFDDQDPNNHDFSTLKRALRSCGWEVSIFMLYHYSKKTKDGYVALFDLSQLNSVGSKKERLPPPQIEGSQQRTTRETASYTGEICKEQKREIDSTEVALCASIQIAVPLKCQELTPDLLDLTNKRPSDNWESNRAEQSTSQNVERSKSGKEISHEDDVSFKKSKERVMKISEACVNLVRLLQDALTKYSGIILGVLAGNTTSLRTATESENKTKPLAENNVNIGNALSIVRIQSFTNINSGIAESNKENANKKA